MKFLDLCEIWQQQTGRARWATPYYFFRQIRTSELIDELVVNTEFSVHDFKGTRTERNWWVPEPLATAYQDWVKSRVEQQVGEPQLFVMPDELTKRLKAAQRFKAGDRVLHLLTGKQGIFEELHTGFALPEAWIAFDTETEHGSILMSCNPLEIIKLPAMKEKNVMFNKQFNCDFIDLIAIYRDSNRDCRPCDWIRLESTKQLFKELAASLKCEVGDLVTRGGKRASAFCWIHPHLYKNWRSWADKQRLKPENESSELPSNLADLCQLRSANKKSETGGEEHQSVASSIKAKLSDVWTDEDGVMFHMKFNCEFVELVAMYRKHDRYAVPSVWLTLNATTQLQETLASSLGCSLEDLVIRAGNGRHAYCYVHPLLAESWKTWANNQRLKPKAVEQENLPKPKVEVVADGVELDQAESSFTCVPWYPEQIEALVRSPEPFPVDFDDAWQWAEYSTKGSAKRKLERIFKVGLDYTVITIVKRVKGNRGGGSVQFESIKLTTDCFKSFVAMAETAKGKEVREYFINCERELKRIKGFPQPQEGQSQQNNKSSLPERYPEEAALAVASTVKSIHETLVHTDARLAQILIDHAMRSIDSVSNPLLESAEANGTKLNANITFFR